MNDGKKAGGLYPDGTGDQEEERRDRHDCSGVDRAGLMGCRGNPMTLTPWVKKLGQWHLYDSEKEECVCGQVALGNNYDRIIPEAERTKCEKCWRDVK